jgi:hypothetical protein
LWALEETVEPIPTSIATPKQTQYGDEAGELYQKGMDAFLQGDYDKAILWAAKSLQVDPSFKKSQDLLSVLVVEKERGNQTEIWLGNRTHIAPEPAVAPTPDLSDIRRDILGLGNRVSILEKKDPSSRLERRIQIITAMMQKSAKDDYQDLKDAQDKSIEKMERLGSGQRSMGLSLFWLFVLVVISLILSIWNLIRKKTKAPRLNVE